MKYLIALAVFASFVFAQDKKEFPKIASVNISKPLPSGELSIVRIAGDDYFVVKRPNKDLPEIAERIDCTKAKVLVCPNGIPGGKPGCGYDDGLVYSGKEKGWKAACDPKHPGAEPEMVFFAGGDPDFK